MPGRSQTVVPPAAKPSPRKFRPVQGFLKKGMEEPAHVAILKELSQPLIYKNSEDYKAFAMRIIEEQQELIKQLGLGAR